MRMLSRKSVSGIGLHDLQVRAAIDVGDAFAMGHSGPRFAAPLCARYLNSAEKAQIAFNLRIGNTRTISARRK